MQRVMVYVDGFNLYFGLVHHLCVYRDRRRVRQAASVGSVASRLHFEPLQGQGKPRTAVSGGPLHHGEEPPQGDQPGVAGGHASTATAVPRGYLTQGPGRERHGATTGISGEAGEAEGRFNPRLVPGHSGGADRGRDLARGGTGGSRTTVSSPLLAGTSRPVAPSHDHRQVADERLFLFQPWSPPRSALYCAMRTHRRRQHRARSSDWGSVTWRSPPSQADPDHRSHIGQVEAALHALGSAACHCDAGCIGSVQGGSEPIADAC